MEKYRVLVVCGTGMGSSMILKVMVDRVVSDNQLPIIVDSDVVAGAKSSQADFFVSGLDLVPTLEKIGRPVVGIKNMIDRKEILEKLQEQLAKFKRDATN
ncbi:PTS sugar transporter subunit IIB [Bellilinea sp.]